MNNWLEIAEDALTANFAAVQAAARAQHGARTEVLAVVKANGYGHGAPRCARPLAGAGARWLGVTCAAEGVRVRAALGGAAADILVMCGSLPEDRGALIEGNLVPVLWTAEQVAMLPRGWRVHLEIDTGMGRQGVMPGAELDGLLGQIRAAGLVLDGVFTHFCSSEEVPGSLTLSQQGRFAGAVAQVRARGFTAAFVHAGNSSAVDNPVGTADWLERLAASLGARPMVRTGLALYGYTLALAGREHALAVRPVLRWLAHALAVRELAAGETVGYNATFTAPGAMRVAVLAVGYADGLRRELSGGGWVLFGDERAPILGRISMNLTVVDITGLPGVGAGSVATLLGPGVTAADHARLAGTIAYEILCGLHPCG